MWPSKEGCPFFPGFLGQFKSPVICTGLTLRETIYKDKADCRAGLREVVFGKTYWSRLRALFTASGDIDDILKLAKGEAPAEPLYLAFKALLRHPPNRSLMMSWAARTDTLTMIEVKVILMSLRRIAPCVSDEQREVGLALLRVLQRSEASKHFPDLFGLLRSCYDDIICQLPIPAHQLVRTNEHMLAFLMSRL